MPPTCSMNVVQSHPLKAVSFDEFLNEFLNSFRIRVFAKTEQIFFKESDLDYCFETKSIKSHNSRVIST